MGGHSSTHDRTKPESVHLPCKPTQDTATEKPGQAGHSEGEGRSNVVQGGLQGRTELHFQLVNAEAGGMEARTGG